MASAPAYREKSTFKWTTECQAAFDYLKKCLTSAPTLTMPNWSQPFVIDTDASDTGIYRCYSVAGNMIEHVVAYASRILTKSERNYCKELLAVVSFLQHFHQFCLDAILQFTQTMVLSPGSSNFTFYKAN